LLLASLPFQDEAIIFTWKKAIRLIYHQGRRLVCVCPHTGNANMC